LSHNPVIEPNLAVSMKTLILQRPATDRYPRTPYDILLDGKKQGALGCGETLTVELPETWQSQKLEARAPWGRSPQVGLADLSSEGPIEVRGNARLRATMAAMAMLLPVALLLGGGEASLPFKWLGTALALGVMAAAVAGLWRWRHRWLEIKV
jgi:hypothetical protein